LGHGPSTPPSAGCRSSNPSAETFEEGVKPLLAEAHDRLARQHAPRGRTAGE
jgi:hypothetical protein